MPDFFNQENTKIAERMAKIKRKIMVMSGKGGVGKTSVTVNLASALSNLGCKVGVLDTDIHGPNTAKMLGCENKDLLSEDGVTFSPIVARGGILLMSLSFALETSDTPVIWRGMMKNNAIKQFVGDTEWGELDYLIIDTPPGTGDEQLTISQTIKDITGSVIITTPQEVAVNDARRTVNFSKKMGINVIGVVENMAGLICPHCGEEIPLFGKGGGEKMAKDMGVPFLGSVPLDPGFAEAEDRGFEWVAGDTLSARRLRDIAIAIHSGNYEKEKENNEKAENGSTCGCGGNCGCEE